MGPPLSPWIIGQEEGWKEWRMADSPGWRRTRAPTAPLASSTVKHFWLGNRLIFFVLLLIWWKWLYFGYHPHSDMIVALVMFKSAFNDTDWDMHCFRGKEGTLLGYVGPSHGRFYTWLLSSQKLQEYPVTLVPWQIIQDTSNGVTL